MRCRFIAEYEGGVRNVVCWDVGTIKAVADASATYRECARLLRERPLAHRVECWDGSRYVTRATRGVEARTRETIAAEREGHGGECMCAAVCMPTAKDEASE